VAPPQPTASGGPDAPTATGQPAEESAGTSSGKPSPPAETGSPDLVAGPAVTPDPLLPGRPGEIQIIVRNAGTTTATDLTADISLPPDIVLRGAGGIPGTVGVEPAAAGAGGSEQIATAPPWRCVRTPTGASCTRTSLAPGGTADIVLRVFVGAAAQSGTLTGTVTATGGWVATIPASPVEVQPA